MLFSEDPRASALKRAATTCDFTRLERAPRALVQPEWQNLDELTTRGATMMVAGGTIWLVYHGLVLLALSYTTMGVFTNLSPTELHPNVPLATPIPSDFFDETTQYMMGRRSGWCGELLTICLLYTSPSPRDRG